VVKQELANEVIIEKTIPGISLEREQDHLFEPKSYIKYRLIEREIKESR